MFDRFLQQISALASTQGVDEVARLLDAGDVIDLAGELDLLQSTEQCDAEREPSRWMADLVLMVRAQARLVAHHRARMLEATARLLTQYEELAEGDVEAGIDGTVAELRCALSLTRRAAEAEVDLAWRLRDRLPAVGKALFAGDLCVDRARIIVHGTDHVDVHVARRVADEALTVAPTMTTGRLRAFVRKLCAEADPDDAVTRYGAAVDGRRVTGELTLDGTGTMVASDLPAEQVAAAMDRIDRIARRLSTGDETRTIDQLRADVFLDLLTGGVDNIRANVDLTVDVETLAQLADRSAELGGMGPIVADIARDMADSYGSKWRYAVVDPSGDVLVTGTARRRPTVATRRAVEMRDRTCVFPGCRRPARRSDLDHMTPWSQGGRTDVSSMAACCRHDHVVRHRFNWSYVRNPDGSYTWTAPSGRSYTRPPPSL